MKLILNMMNITEDQQVWFPTLFFFENKAVLVVTVNEELVEELHKPVVKRRKVYARLQIDNIWAADLPDMKSNLLSVKVLNIYCV